MICDGYEKVPESFKKFAREQNFLDEALLHRKGFMHKDSDENFRMNDMQTLMDSDVKSEDVPANLLHCFEV